MKYLIVAVMVVSVMFSGCKRIETEEKPKNDRPPPVKYDEK